MYNLHRKNKSLLFYDESWLVEFPLADVKISKIIIQGTTVYGVDGGGGLRGVLKYNL